MTFHYTPTRASWLNQVEGGWFSILQGQSLTGASFTSVEQLKTYGQLHHVSRLIGNLKRPRLSEQTHTRCLLEPSRTQNIDAERQPRSDDELWRNFNDIGFSFFLNGVPAVVEALIKKTSRK